MNKEYEEYSWKHFLKIIENKKFWIYGAGHRGSRFLKRNSCNDIIIRVNGFIDADNTKTICDGIPVYHLDILDRLSKDEVILISPINSGSILSGLEDQGFINCFIIPDDKKEFAIVPEDIDSEYICLYAPIGLGKIELSTTLLTLLDKNESFIFSDFSKTNKYEIKRAQNRDAYEMEHFEKPTRGNLQDFLVLFKKFLIQKKLDDSVADSFYSIALEKFRSDGRLQISHMWAQEKKIEIYHVYYTVGNERVRLSCSASLFRSDLSNDLRAENGRLNRLLHWKDICEFKRQGLYVYDWGGVNWDDAEKASVSGFKLGFSNLQEKRYNILDNEDANSIEKRKINIYCDKQYYEYAIDICNQLSDRYCVYINADLDDRACVPLKLPEAIVDKKMWAYNPVHFFNLGYEIIDFSVVEFTDIKDFDYRKKNNLLNHTDVVRINIFSEKDILDMIDCMATGVIIIALAEKKYKNIVKEIMQVDNLHMCYNIDSNNLILQEIEKRKNLYIENRILREKRANLIAEKYSIKEVIDKAFQ